MIQKIMTFITKSLRPLGMFIFFLFAVACIFASMLERDLESSGYVSQFLEYTISFENRFYDFRMKTQLDPNFKSKEIVLVKIDDYSLEKLGVWPIPRTNHAILLDKLSNFGAKVAAFDVLFPEKSPIFGDISPDTALAESIKNFQAKGGRVFLPFTLTSNTKDALTEAPLEMLNDAIQTRNVPEVDMEPKKISRFTFPIEELIATETGVGNIDAEEDPDGVFRHYQLIANVDTIYYGSLGFNSFEAYTGKKNTIKISGDATGELNLDRKKMEISRNGEAKIRYVGGEGQFDSVSLYDLINAKDDDPKMHSLFNGKMVFIGSTALGAHDLRNTPIDAKMPGVYTHMNMAHMLLHKYFFQNINDSIKYSLLLLCLGMLLFAFVQKLGNPFVDAVVTLIHV
jgi:adenylate cyclase